MKDRIEFILKFVSTLSIIIFVFSIVRSHFFFDQFGINFSEYIEFKDIPRYIIKDFIVYLPPIILMGMVMVFIYLSPYNNMNKKKPVFLIDYLFLYWREVLTWGLIAVCLFLIFSNSPMSSKWDGSRIYDYYLFAIPFCFLLVIVLNKINSKESGYQELITGILITGIIAAALFYSAMILGVEDANEIKRGKNDNIYIEINNNKFNKENGYRYVGKTSQYIFIVDTSENTQIIPIKELEVISVKKRKKNRPILRQR